MAEVAAQLKPFHDAIEALRAELNRVGEHGRKLWRNGTRTGNEPPGYLEVAREQDKERINALMENQASMDLKLDTLLAAKNVSDGSAQGAESTKEGWRKKATLVLQIAGLLVALTMAAIGIASFVAALKIKSGELSVPIEWHNKQSLTYTADDSPPQDARTPNLQ